MFCLTTTDRLLSAVLDEAVATKVESAEIKLSETSWIVMFIAVLPALDLQKSAGSDSENASVESMDQETGYDCMIICLNLFFSASSCFVTI